MTTKFQKSIKKESQNQWDKKSIITLIIFCSLIIFFVLILSIDIKGIFIQNDKNWNSTTGIIQSIENVTIMEQTRTGNRNQVVQYKIRYLYIVNDVEYNKEIVQSANMVTNRLINRIDYPRNCKIEILYKKDNPSNSYINTNINSNFYKVI
jgi:hypothetical protein